MSGMWDATTNGKWQQGDGIMGFTKTTGDPYCK